VASLEAMIACAALESPEFAARADRANNLVACLIEILSSANVIEAHLGRRNRELHDDFVTLFDALGELIRDLPAPAVESHVRAALDKIEVLRGRLGTLTPEGETGSVSEDASNSFLAERLSDLLDVLAEAIGHLRGLDGPAIAMLRRRSYRHLDFRAALHRGLRACTAVGLAGSLWILTGWSAGPSFILVTAVVCTLFSTAKRPDRAGFDFFAGISLGITASFVCLFFVVPSATGFPLFILSMALVLIPGAMSMRHPKTAGIGTAFCLQFLVQLMPLNTTSYNVVFFLNSGLASVAAAICGILAYRIVLPVDPVAECRYLLRCTDRDLERLAFAKRPLSGDAWQSLMFDRMNRLMGWKTSDESLQQALASLRIGLHILRLRNHLRENSQFPQLRSALESVLEIAGRLTRAPHAAAVAAREAIQHLRNTAWDDLPGSRKVIAPIIGELGELSLVLDCLKPC
jgi:uncharacterized membrane protein YccC